MKQNALLPTSKRQECRPSPRLVTKMFLKHLTLHVNLLLSVALKTSKKDFEQSVRSFQKERKSLQKELENLNDFKIVKDAEQKQIKKAEKKSRQKAKKASKETTDKVHFEDQNLKELPVDNNNFEEIAEPSIANTDASAKPEKQAQAKSKESYTFKSDDPRFLEFPEKFEDWSEDQKKDAYDNSTSRKALKSIIE